MIPSSDNNEEEKDNNDYNERPPLGPPLLMSTSGKAAKMITISRARAQVYSRKSDSARGA